MAVAHQRPAAELRPSPVAEPPTRADTRRYAPIRADTLSRIAAEVSGHQDLGGLFRDVIDEAFEAHLDPRSVQVPGTPLEPEALIVVPLFINGATIGTPNIGLLDAPQPGALSVGRPRAGSLADQLRPPSSRSMNRNRLMKSR